MSFDNEDVVKDIKTHSIESVLQKYNITFKELFDICEKYYTMFDDNDDYEHITRTRSKTWSIQKTLDGESHYYGTYKSKQEAQSIVQELKKVNWDDSELENILKKLNIKTKRSK